MVTTSADSQPDRAGALVTGGGSGIGLACAQHLAAAGQVVTICGRSRERLDQALGHLPHGSRAVEADVTDASSLDEAAAAAAEDTDGLATWVANAGGAFALGPLPLVDPAAFAHELEVNVTGTLLTLQACVPHLVQAGGGAVVAVSSIAGGLTHRLMAAYSTSKAGMEMLVRNAADELGRFSVRVNGVRPGLVPTDASAPLVADSRSRADYLAQMPLGRVGTTDDIAAAVAFLAGPSATWMTGQVLAVDGGHSLRRGPDLYDQLGTPAEGRLAERLGLDDPDAPL